MKRILLGVAAILALLVAAFAGAAQARVEPLPAPSESGAYGLTWWSVDGSGETLSSGGSYTLGATVGSPDAGLLAGGDYTMGGGFWGGGEVAEAAYGIYLPLAIR
jgi:hypothetical protein